MKGMGGEGRRKKGRERGRKRKEKGKAAHENYVIQTLKPNPTGKLLETRTSYASEMLKRVGGNWGVSTPTSVMCWLGLVTEDHKDSQTPAMMSMHSGNLAD